MVLQRCNIYETCIADGYKKDPQLIELQDSSSARQQAQLQEEADLRSLQEQEQSVRQLEVSFQKYYLKKSTLYII